MTDMQGKIHKVSIKFSDNFSIIWVEIMAFVLDAMEWSTRPSEEPD